MSFKSFKTDPIKHFPRTDKVKDPLPEQYPALIAAKEFLENESLSVLINRMPTASGKTLTSLAEAIAWHKAGGAAVLIAPTKDLQMNFKKDAPPGTINTVMGAVEFACAKDPTVTCGSRKAKSSCDSRPLSESALDSMESNCPYQAQRLKAATEARMKPICFTPHSYIAYKKHPALGKYLPNGDGLMIIDEAHLLPAMLRSFISLSIDSNLIDIALNFSKGEFMSEFFKKHEATNEEGLPITLVRKQDEEKTIYLGALAEGLTSLANHIKSNISNPQSHIRLFPRKDFVTKEDCLGLAEAIDELSKKISSMLNQLHESFWIAESKRNSFNGDESITEPSDDYVLTLTPTAIPKSFLNDFFSGFSKIILMSGTIFPTHLKMLGLIDDGESALDHVSIFEMQSRISVERRKIIIDSVNGHAINRSNLEESFTAFAYWAQRIANRVPGEKGMIHVSSNSQARLLTKKLRAVSGTNRGQELIIFNQADFKSWKEVFEAFKAAKPQKHQNIFLVAARRYEGIDLADDLARIVLFAKTPFVNKADTMVQCLEHLYPGYYDTETLTSLIQGCNRGTRKPTDWSLIAIFDTTVRSVLSRHGSSLPEFIQEAFEESDSTDWIESWRSPTY